MSYFVDSLVEWCRGFPRIRHEAKISEQTERCIRSFAYPAGSAMVLELFRICLAAGFIRGDNDETATYDGSRISKVLPHLAQVEGTPGQILLEDFWPLRSGKSVSFWDWLDAIVDFFWKNEDVFSCFPREDGEFYEKYRAGVFRVDGLFSLFGIEDMDLSGFLNYLAENMRFKKKVLGKMFTRSHQSSSIPIDHIPGLNTHKYWGPAKRIGKIEVKGLQRDVFLLFGPGLGTAQGGLRLALALDNPSGQMFDVSFDLRNNNGKWLPTILKIQRSPYQLDSQLRYHPEFIPYQSFPSINLQKAVQDAISEQLLGGGDVFYTFLMAIATICNSLGFSHLQGWPGERNKWLNFHDNRPDAVETVYHSTYRSLKMQREEISSCWNVSLNGNYCNILGQLLRVRRMEQLHKIKSERDFGGGNIQPITVSLPTYKQQVTEKGLARIVEAVYRMLPHLRSRVSVEECLSTMDILRKVNEEQFWIGEREKILIYRAQNPPKF